MSILKRVIVIVAFGVWVFAPLSANAIQMETVGSVASWKTVYYEFNNTGHEGLAGEFQLIIGEGDDAFDTVGYCVELDEGVSTPSIYEVELKPADFRDNGLDAAWLMNEYAYGLGNETGGGDIMEAQAALQLAIWDTVYGDNFTVLGATSDSIEALYTGYINGLADAKSSGAYNTDFASSFRVTHKDEVQDLLIHVPNSSTATPEPGTVLLLGCGLLALGFIQTRRQKQNRSK